MSGILKGLITENRINVEEGVIYQFDNEDPLNKSEILVLGGAGRYSFEGLRNKARREAQQLAKDLEVDHPYAFERSAYNIKQLENTLKTIVAAYEEMEKIRRQGGSRSRNIKDLEETDDWSNLSKRDFKRKELDYELRHERNNYAVYINGKLWKVFADEKQANNIARSLRNKGKDAKVHLTGLDPTNEGYSAGTVGGAGLGIEKSPMEKVLEKPLGEDNSKQLSVEELATISDEALDKAYGYGRSSPGNTFGWQANLMSAAYAKKMIDSGVTDIEKISDAIHKGWNVTAQKFVQDPDQFSDTEKLRQAGKLDAKLQQRAKLMKINYAQLDNDEQEKDRVVARALLQAIKGEIAETLQSTQGGMGQSYRKFTPKSAGTESLNEYDDHLVGTVINNVPKGLTIDEFYPKAFSEMLYWKYRRAEKDNFLSVAKGWYDEYKQKHNMKEYKTDQRAPMLIKDIDRIENLLYTLPKGLDFNKFLDVALRQYIDNKYSTKEFPEWKTKTKYLYWDAYKKAGKDKPEGVINKIKSWFEEEQAPMFTPEEKMVNANDPRSDGWRVYKAHSAGTKESAIMKGLQTESTLSEVNPVNVWATMSGRGQGGIPADLRVSEIPIDQIGSKGLFWGSYRDTVFYNIMSGNAFREYEQEYKKKGKEPDVEKIKQQVIKLARAAGLEQDADGKWYFDVYTPMTQERKSHMTYLEYNFGRPYDKKDTKSKKKAQTTAALANESFEGK